VCNLIVGVGSATTSSSESITGGQATLFQVRPSMCSKCSTKIFIRSWCETVSPGFFSLWMIQEDSSGHPPLPTGSHIVFILAVFF
jgi:hypothetical protein